MEELLKKAIEDSDTPAQCRSLASSIDNVPGDRHKVAVLSGYTTKGLGDCIKAKACAHGILVRCYEGEYSQWRQEIMGQSLYESEPLAIFLLVDLFGMEDEAFFGYSDPVFDLKGYALSRLEELWKYVSVLKGKTRAKIIVANNVKPAPLMGPLEGKALNSLVVAIDGVNRKMMDMVKDDSQIFIFDMDGWLGRMGKKDAWCNKFMYMADMKLSPNAMPALAEEFMSYLVPLFGKKKKCIVLDLDNTLWGGIVGEDGVGGIRLSPTGDGQSFYYFQKLLFHYKRQGFLLAICSRNNEEDVREVFEKHPHMVLKENDFVASRINWEDKAANIRSIATELNIGLDSLVFIDDDPTNTMSVKQMLKDVDVITLPKDPTEYMSALMAYKGLSSLEYTEEDSKRTDMYISDKQRKKFETEAVDMDSFLKGLNIALTIKPVDEISLKRGAQLTQKTNQFNLTTCRYTEEDIKKLIDENHKIWTLEVSDKFGDYGIVGFCIVKNVPEHWEVDTLLMSCRVLGRKIENDFFNHIIRELHAAEPKKIRGSYIPTKKNMQVKDFYKAFDFKHVGTMEGRDIWELETHAYAVPPAAAQTTKI